MSTWHTLEGPLCIKWWGNNFKQARGAPQHRRSNEQRLHQCAYQQNDCTRSRNTQSVHESQNKGSLRNIIVGAASPSDLTQKWQITRKHNLHNRIHDNEQYSCPSNWPVRLAWVVTLLYATLIIYTASVTDLTSTHAGIILHIHISYCPTVSELIHSDNGNDVN